MTGLNKEQRRLLEIDVNNGTYDDILEMFPDAGDDVDSYLKAGKAYYADKQTKLGEARRRDYAYNLPE